MLAREADGAALSAMRGTAGGAEMRRETQRSFDEASFALFSA